VYERVTWWLHVSYWILFTCCNMELSNKTNTTNDKNRIFMNNYKIVAWRKFFFLFNISTSVFHLPAFCNNICCSFAHEATEDYTKRETHLEELWIETESTSHGIIFSEFGRYVHCQRVVALIFFK
jgi:hypothetical protein